MNTVVSLALEVNSNDIWICYSTTEYGDSGPSITGGAIRVTPEGSVLCWKDANPLVVSVECSTRDDEPSSPGYTYDVWITVQSTTHHLQFGVELGTFGSIVCLRDTTLYTPVGTIPFASLGVCT